MMPKENLPEARQLPKREVSVATKTAEQLESAGAGNRVARAAGVARHRHPNQIRAFNAGTRDRLRQGIGFLPTGTAHILATRPPMPCRANACCVFIRGVGGDWRG